MLTTGSETNGSLATTEHRVKEILVEILGLEIAPDEIGSTEPLVGDGVGLDSVATIEFIVALEERLGAPFPDDGLTQEVLYSIHTVAGYIHTHFGPLQARPETNGTR